MFCVQKFGKFEWHLEDGNLEHNGGGAITGVL